MQRRLLRSETQDIAWLPPTGTLDQIARRRHALVISFRRDGTPVGTPVWIACVNGRAYARVERSSGKVKRLRREPRALLVPCTRSGRPVGQAVAVQGRVCAARSEQAAELALASHHGLVRRLFEASMDLLRIDMCYLEFMPEESNRTG